MDTYYFWYNREQENLYTTTHNNEKKASNECFRFGIHDFVVPIGANKIYLTALNRVYFPIEPNVLLTFARTDSFY